MVPKNSAPRNDARFDKRASDDARLCAFGDHAFRMHSRSCAVAHADRPRANGSGGLLGLLFAAAICLFSGLIAEALSGFVSRTSPFGAVMIGMMVRMFVPLGVCVALLATGQSGRDHLPFIGYLLTFYMVTLGLETWLAVKRSSGPPSTSNRSPR